ncbi:hypothetical protein O181_022157 [Austropuccinia psidii MF-1]|uniref:Uncharacterized protein n=1 Tax=Austropuccinia psidii MF-1 TaxID=1389203 RepID=A0A9Q3GWV8_9BASI|nr:hypothetical protein [Austropuccinia psidii MF-1]
MDIIIDGMTLREIIPTVPSTLLKPEDWKDMDKAYQIHQLLKDLYQWRMDNKRFKLELHWEKMAACCQKAGLKEIPFKDLMVITKGLNPKWQFKLLEERAARIRDNQATFQSIEEKLNQK